MTKIWIEESQVNGEEVHSICYNNLLHVVED